MAFLVAVAMRSETLGLLTGSFNVRLLRDGADGVSYRPLMISATSADLERLKYFRTTRRKCVERKLLHVTSYLEYRIQSTALPALPSDNARRAKDRRGRDGLAAE